MLGDRWARWISLLVLMPVVLARQREISTQSVQSCINDSIITVSNFAVAYFPDTDVIQFDIEGRSLSDNVSPIINFEVVAYGNSYYNYTYNLCGLLDGGLCPLPTYNFTAIGAASTAGLSVDLPGIAYTIPNLEAVAIVRLTDQDNGELVTCLEVTLSNGWTTGYPGVAWAAGGILIGAFIAAALHSFLPLSPHRAGPEWRFLTIIGFYQWIAACGLLSLNYAGLYQVFTLNFAWSLGLINIHPFERSYDRTRIRDGGRNITGDSFSASSLSYSFGVPKTTISNAAIASAPVVNSPLAGIQRGIAQYVEQQGIPYPNAFVTVLVIFLLFCAVVIALLLLFFIVVELVIRTKGKKHDADWRANLRQDANYAAITNVLRCLLAGVFPLVLFAFYTFLTEETSGWAFELLAALTLAAMIVVCLSINVRRYYNSKGEKLETVIFDSEHPDHHIYSRRWQALYAEFKPAFWWFFFPWIIVSVVRAAFIAFAQGHPWVQTMALLVIEVVFFIGLCIVRPFRRKATNALEIVLSLVRIASIALLVPAITSLSINRFVVTGLGIGLLAIQSLIVVWFFVLTVFNLGAGLLWARKKHVVEGEPLPFEKRAQDADEKNPGEQGIVGPGRPFSDTEGAPLSRPHSSGDTTLAEAHQPWNVGKQDRSSLKREIMPDEELYAPHPSRMSPAPQNGSQLPAPIAMPPEQHQAHFESYYGQPQ